MLTRGQSHVVQMVHPGLALPFVSMWTLADQVKKKKIVCVFSLPVTCFTTVSGLSASLRHM